MQHAAASACVCHTSSAGHERLALPCRVPWGQRTRAHVGPEHPDSTNISSRSGLGLMQCLCLFKIPANSPVTHCYVGREVETVGKKGLCKWHSFRQPNPCSATVLLDKFSLKVVILYKLACYLISSALKSSSRFLNHSGERRKGVSRLLALEYLMSPS